MSEEGRKLSSMFCLVQLCDSSDLPENKELAFLKPRNKDPIGVVPNHWRRMYLIADGMMEYRETGDVWYDQLVQANIRAIFETFSNSIIEISPVLENELMLICVDWNIFSLTKEEEQNLNCTYNDLLSQLSIIDDQIVCFLTLQ